MKKFILTASDLPIFAEDIKAEAQKPPGEVRAALNVEHEPVKESVL